MFQVCTSVEHDNLISTIAALLPPFYLQTFPMTKSLWLGCLRENELGQNNSVTWQKKTKISAWTGMKARRQTPNRTKTSCSRKETEAAGLLTLSFTLFLSSWKIQQWMIEVVAAVVVASNLFHVMDFFSQIINASHIYHNIWGTSSNFLLLIKNFVLYCVVFSSNGKTTCTFV